LTIFFGPFNRRVKSYSIEKFSVIEKKHLINYLPETDLSDNPKFAIGGMGLFVELEKTDKLSLYNPGVCFSAVVRVPTKKDD
jgi:hypothetical protein